MKHLLLLLTLVPTATQLAHQQKTVTADAAQEKCLATTIYGEARGESFNGKVAVAYTLLNRAKNKTLCDVALAPKQYSIFNNNPQLRKIATSLHLKPEQKNKIDKQSWQQSELVAKLVFNRYIKDPTNGATHYLAPKVMKSKNYRYPKWSKQFKVVATIQNHTFFKIG